MKRIKARFYKDFRFGIGRFTGPGFYPHYIYLDLGWLCVTYNIDCKTKEIT